MPSVVCGSVAVRMLSPQLNGGCRKGIVFLSLVKIPSSSGITGGDGRSGDAVAQKRLLHLISFL